VLSFSFSVPFYLRPPLPLVLSVGAVSCCLCLLLFALLMGIDFLFASRSAHQSHSHDATAADCRNRPTAIGADRFPSIRFRCIYPSREKQYLYQFLLDFNCASTHKNIQTPLKSTDTAAQFPHVPQLMPPMTCLDSTAMEIY
jgi:hypothetical protein